MTVIVVPTMLLWILVALSAMNAAASIYRHWLARKVQTKRLRDMTERDFAEALCDTMRPMCWCETCDETANGLRTRMSVCPQCGDKRCPKAAYHGNECKTPNV